MHEVLVNCLGGLSLPRKSVVRLTDRPDMTLDVYRGRKTTIQHNNDVYFLDFRVQKFPLIFFNVNPFSHQEALQFGVLNDEKQHKKAPVKFREDLLYFQHFMLIFVFAPN